MGRSRRIIVSSAEEMKELGKTVGFSLQGGAVLALFGDLGAGKTTFVQGLASALGIEEPVSSPTFTYLNQYTGAIPLFHFDLYRFHGEKDFLGMGFHEYFDLNGICAIEWPERIEAILPGGAMRILFSHQAQERVVEIQWG